MVATSSLLGHLRALSAARRPIVREALLADGETVARIGEPVTELTFLLAGALRRHVGELEVRTLHYACHAELVSGGEALLGAPGATHRQTLSAVGGATIARVAVREIGQMALKELISEHVVRLDVLVAAADAQTLDAARMLDEHLGGSLAGACADERSSFFRWLALNACEATFADGEALSVAGKPAHAFYLVTGGIVAIYDESTPARLVGTRGSGGAVGEAALLADEGRRYTATIRAKGRCTALRFDARMRADLRARFPGIVRCVRARLMDRLVRQWMALRDLPDSDAIGCALATLVDHARFERGEVVARSGQYGARVFFVLSGECAVCAQPDFFARYSAGSFFGLAAMLPPGRRTQLSAHASALSDCQLLVADPLAVSALARRFPGLVDELRCASTHLSTLSARCSFLARYLPSYVLHHIDAATPLIFLPTNKIRMPISDFKIISRKAMTISGVLNIQPNNFRAVTR